MLSLERSFVDQMVAHALNDNPNECCGILAGKQGQVLKLYRITNTEHSPYRYNMDPKELYKVYREIEDNGMELMALYHSHTHSEAYPSATDVRLASWPEAFYILISLMDRGNPVVRAFHILEGRVKEEELQIGYTPPSP